MINLPFSSQQLFTHQQQRFQLKQWSGGIFISADTSEAHVSLQAWMNWCRRLGREEVGRLMRDPYYWQLIFSLFVCSFHRFSFGNALIQNIQGNLKACWKQRTKQRSKVVCECVYVFVFTAIIGLWVDEGWRTPRLIFDSCAVSAGSDVTGQC